MKNIVLNLGLPIFDILLAMFPFLCSYQQLSYALA